MATWTLVKKDTWDVHVRSVVSGRVNTRQIKATPTQMRRFAMRNELVQDIFPDLSAEDREFLISGLTPEEWKELFGE